MEINLTTGTDWLPRMVLMTGFIPRKHGNDWRIRKTKIKFSSSSRIQVWKYWESQKSEEILIFGCPKECGRRRINNIYHIVHCLHADGKAAPAMTYKLCISHLCTHANVRGPFSVRTQDEKLSHANAKWQLAFYGRSKWCQRMTEKKRTCLCRNEDAKNETYGAAGALGISDCLFYVFACAATCSFTILRYMH